MKGPALAEAVTQLSWLSPDAGNLVLLARAPTADAWAELRRDPGALLLLLRFTGRLDSLPTGMLDPRVLQGALSLLDPPGIGFVDWNRPETALLHQSALTLADLADRLARRQGRIDPDLAWSAGLLAPLGWLGVAALEPQAVAACLADPEFAGKPCAVQQRLWGLDHGALTRRLASRWQLPTRLAVALGHLDLAPENAASLDVDLELFRLLQLTVSLAQQQGVPLQLPVGGRLEENAIELGFDVDEVRAEALQPAAAGHAKIWQPPAQQPLLRDLLMLAAEKKSWSTGPVLEGLEDQIDQLHRALRDQRRSEEIRLHAAKLRALAELAGGAGHEINNPLAVISGQAQYLLPHEVEPTRQQSLRKIVGQAKRIHDILTQLMQFARPPKPNWQSLNLSALVREAVGSVTGDAAERQVELRCRLDELDLVMDGDLRLIRNILISLLRNAIEATPPGGWARVRLAVHTDHVEIFVEDNGPGPNQDQREHLFDPFYSGREAGRGRGLGLPTAWRLAGALGGDVRFERVDDITQFVLKLPRHSQPALRGGRANGDHHDLPAWKPLPELKGLEPLNGLDKHAD